MQSIEERDMTLAALEPHVFEMSAVFRKCCLSLGKGALLVYADSVLAGHIPGANSYRTRKEILELFDNVDSTVSLNKLIEAYDPKSEGVMVVITSINNASYFVTVKLKSR